MEEKLQELKKKMEAEYPKMKIFPVHNPYLEAFQVDEGNIKYLSRNQPTMIVLDTGFVNPTDYEMTVNFLNNNEDTEIGVITETYIN